MTHDELRGWLDNLRTDLGVWKDGAFTLLPSDEEAIEDLKRLIDKDSTTNDQ